MDLEEQYEKIYRYCYFKLHQRELAEDITQEAFLRFFDKHYASTSVQPLQYLYTIARNLCIDEYRKPHTEYLEDDIQESSKEEQLLTGVIVKAALAKLNSKEQELLLLRYVNEVPISTIGQFLGISRFAVHRKLISASKKLKEYLREEDFV